MQISLLAQIKNKGNWAPCDKERISVSLAHTTKVSPEDLLTLCQLADSGDVVVRLFSPQSQFDIQETANGQLELTVPVERLQR